MMFWYCIMLLYMIDWLYIRLLLNKIQFNNIQFKSTTGTWNQAGLIPTFSYGWGGGILVPLSLSVCELCVFLKLYFTSDRMTNATA